MNASTSAPALESGTQSSEGEVAVSSLPRVINDKEGKVAACGQIPSTKSRGDCSTNLLLSLERIGQNCRGGGEPDETWLPHAYAGPKTTVLKKIRDMLCKAVQAECAQYTPATYGCKGVMCYYHYGGYVSSSSRSRQLQVLVQPATSATDTSSRIVATVGARAPRNTHPLFGQLGCVAITHACDPTSDTPAPGTAGMAVGPAAGRLNGASGWVCGGPAGQAVQTQGFGMERRGILC